MFYAYAQARWGVWPRTHIEVMTITQNCTIQGVIIHSFAVVWYAAGNFVEYRGVLV